MTNATIDASKKCSIVCYRRDHKKAALLCLECAEIGEVLIRFRCSNAYFTVELRKLFALICQACKDESAMLDFFEAKYATTLWSASITFNEKSDD